MAPVRPFQPRPAEPFIVPGQRAAAGAGAFGAATAQALEVGGRQLQQGVADIASMLGQAAALNNRSAIRDSDIAAREAEMGALRGFLETRGEATQAALPALLESIRTIQGAQLEAAPNPRVQEELSAIFRDRNIRMEDSATRYALDQSRQWALQSHEGSTQVFGQQGMMARLDPAEVNEFAAAVVAEQQDISELLGEPPEAAQARQMGALGAYYQPIIGALADENFPSATRMFDDVRGNLLPEDQQRIGNFLEARQRQLAAEARAAAAAQRAEARAILEVRVQDQAAMAAAGVVPETPIILADVQRAYSSPDDVARVWAQVERGQAFAADRQAIAMMPPDEAAALIDTRAPEGEGFAAEQAYQEALRAAAAGDQARVLEASGLEPRIRNELQLLYSGQEMPAGEEVGQDELVSLLGSERGGQVWATMEAARDVSVALRQVPLSDVETRRAILARAAPAGADFEAEAERFNILRQAVEADQADRAADPAAYVLRHAPTAQMAWEGLQGQMGNPAAGPADRQAAAAGYAATMRQLQDGAGIPVAERTLLPESYVAQVGQVYAEAMAAPEQGGVAGLVQRQAETWGPLWPEVYRELAEGGALPAAALAIGAGMEPGPARLLAAASSMAAEDLTRGLDRVPATRENVRAALADFAGTLSPAAGVVGGLDTLTTLQSQAEVLALFYRRPEGGALAPDAAAEAAVQQVVLDRYEIVGSGDWAYRIPRVYAGQPMGEDRIANIERGADRVLSGLQPGELALPEYDPALGAEFVESQYLARVRSAGYWLTNADESGLVLMLDGQAVERPDGAPLWLNWTALAEREGRPTPRLMTRSLGVAP